MDGFDIVYSALCSYKSIYGNVKIPQRYVIAKDDEAYPKETWGMKLGKNLNNIRQAGSFKEHKQKLIDLGVSFTIRTKQTPVEFDLLLNALTAYEVFHCDLKIPSNYQIAVGDADYPEETWGMKLGQKLSNIRHNGAFKKHSQILTELGVDFNNIKKQKMSAEFDVLSTALSAYEAAYGHLTVPNNYVISDGDDRFPDATWGMKLGQQLESIAYSDMHQEYKQRLINLGLHYTIITMAQLAEFDLFFSALTAYKDVFNNLEVPHSYVVAEEDAAYPEETWGMKLGQKLTDIIFKGAFHEHRQKLIDLGVEFATTKFDVIFSALTAYKAVNGDVNVPYNYVISEDDNAYPEETWSMKLGQKLNDIRYNLTYKEHKQKLIDLGVDFSSANKKRRTSE